MDIEKAKDEFIKVLKINGHSCISCTESQIKWCGCVPCINRIMGCNKSVF